MADSTTLAAMLQKANDATPEEAKKIYQKIIAEGQGEPAHPSFMAHAYQRIASRICGIAA
jgi:hypothetical protein